jgi:hypothetical protein
MIARAGETINIYKLSSALHLSSALPSDSLSAGVTFSLLTREGQAQGDGNGRSQHYGLIILLILTSLRAVFRFLSATRDRVPCQNQRTNSSV